MGSEEVYKRVLYKEEAPASTFTVKTTFVDDPDQSWTLPRRRQSPSPRMFLDPGNASINFKTKESAQVLTSFWV